MCPGTSLGERQPDPEVAVRVDFTALFSALVMRAAFDIDPSFAKPAPDETTFLETLSTRSVGTCSAPDRRGLQLGRLHIPTGVSHRVAARAHRAWIGRRARGVGDDAPQERLLGRGR